MRTIAVSTALLLLAACSGAGPSPAALAPDSAAASTVTVTAAGAVPAVPPSTRAPSTAPAPNQPPKETSTTTSIPVERLLYDHFAASETFAGGLPIDIHAPAEIGAWPVVVTVHGGGWFAGDRASMGLLADGLADEGMVVFNTEYRTVARGGGFPSTVDDVACAVAYARANASRFTTTPERVFVIGHSAGAHLAALVALAPGVFGDGCELDTSAGPDGMVGLAGPYDTDRLAFLLAGFFGSDFADDPGPWERGNPLTYASTAPDIPILLLHGDADDVVPAAFTEELADALEAAGRSVISEILPGVDHGTVNDPRVVGDQILAFVGS